MVDWEAVGKAMRQLHAPRRRWITKHVSGACGVNTNMVRWQLKESAACPRCNEIETSVHVWTCQHSAAVQLWTDEIELLRAWLVSQGTKNDIQQTLCNNLLLWQRSSEQHRIAHPDFGDQLLLGWGLLVEGGLSITLRHAQQEHFAIIGSRKSGLQWASGLIIRIWHIAWKLWVQRNEFAQQQAIVNQTQLISEAVQAKLQLIESSSQMGSLLGQLAQAAEISRVRTGSFTYQQAWLDNVNATILRNQRRQQTDQHLIRMRNQMRAYLGV